MSEKSFDRLKKSRCGGSGGVVGRRVNLVPLGRQASWPYPVAGNVLTGDSGEAIGAMCDSCVDANAVCREAIEFRGEEIVYHVVEELAKWKPAPRRLR